MSILEKVCFRSQSERIVLTVGLFLKEVFGTESPSTERTVPLFPWLARKGQSEE